MRIDELEITAFRGLLDPVSFKLGARITLLHAPNGTGKTSVCDAVEWLLTGDVARLSEVLKKSADHGVKNLFASEPPCVHARLAMAETTEHFRRMGVGASVQLEYERDGGWHAFAHDELLERITPSNLASLRVRQAHVGRAKWVRAVRFLAPVSLDLLLDSSPDAEDVRGLVFSQLFGVEDLHERENHLRKVLGELPKPMELKRSAKQLEDEIKALEAVAAAESNAPPPAAITPFIESISAAALALELPPSEAGADAAMQLAAIEASAARAVERLAQRRAALDGIIGEWPRYTNSLGRQKEAEAAIRSLAAQRDGLRTKFTTIKEARDIAVGAAVAAEQSVASLGSLGFADLQSRLVPALARWSECGGATSEPLNFDSLRPAARGAQSLADRAKADAELMANCCAALPTWRETAAQAIAADERRAALNVPSAETIAALPQALHQKRNALIAFDAETARLAGPLERLGSLARELLAHFPEEEHCPLCGTDHRSPESLRNEIELHLSEAPAVLSARVEARRRLAEEIASLETQQGRWTELTAESARLQRLAQTARNSLRPAVEQLASLGFQEAAFDDVLGSWLAEALPLLRSAAQARVADAQRAAQQLTAALALDQWREDAEAAATRWRAVFPRASTPSGWSGLRPAQLSERLSAWMDAIESTRADVVAASGTFRAQAAQHDIALAPLAEQLAGIERELGEKNTILGGANAERESLERLWNEFAGAVPWTEDAMNEHPARLRATAEKLATAQAEIAAARAAHNANTEASIRDRAAAERRRQLAAKHLQLQKNRALTELREQLAEGASRLKKARESFVLEQIQPLTEVIETLYLRAQGNAFIDSIRMNAGKNGVLGWLAQAGDRKFADIVQFSQGQRQDLALAIFLARARGVGGTFFLDEPLLHLDDLNRVALLDIFRVLVLERNAQPLHLVITTASSALVRHFREKFALLAERDGEPALRIYNMSGDPQNGVQACEET